MVALAPIPANTTVYFTDNEWDGSVFKASESYTQWVSGASVIPAGTVIRFLAVDLTTLSASTGTLTRATVSGSTNWGISTGEDSVYAYQAATVSSTPTVFLSAICNTSFGTATAGVLTSTGLSLGNGAIETGFAEVISLNTMALAAGRRLSPATFRSFRTSPTGPLTRQTAFTEPRFLTQRHSPSLTATPSVDLSVSASSGTEAGTTAITVTATASAAVTGDQTVSSVLRHRNHRRRFHSLQRDNHDPWRINHRDCYFHRCRRCRSRR